MTSRQSVKAAKVDEEFKTEPKAPPKSSPRGLAGLSRIVEKTASLVKTSSGGSALGDSFKTSLSIGGASSPTKRHSKRRSGVGQTADDELTSPDSSGGLASKISGLYGLKKNVSGRALGEKRTEDFLHEAQAPGLPFIKLKEYGVNWASDTIHMVTNSIRREVMDLYTIMQSMHERRLSLQVGDVASFYIWVDCFADFFIFAILLIKDDLMSWFETWKEVEEDAVIREEGGYMKVASDLKKTMEKIQKHRQDFLRLAPEKAFDKLHRVIKKFVSILIVYLDNVDTQGSTIIEGFSSPDNVNAMETRLVEKAVNSAKKKVNLVLLIRFLEDRPRSLATWKNTHLKPDDRAAHPLYWRRVAKDHFEVVNYFRLSTPSLSSTKK